MNSVKRKNQEGKFYLKDHPFKKIIFYHQLSSNEWKT